MLALIFVDMLALTSSIRIGEPSFWTIYIRADGSVDPPTPLIQRNGDQYILTGNVKMRLDNDGIVIERNNVTFDGADHTVKGASLFSYPKGIRLSERRNVTIKNIRVDSFHYGICLNNSSSSNIVETNVINNSEGIELYGSSNNSVSDSSITNNGKGIGLYYSSNNTVVGNDLTNNSQGILLVKASDCSIAGNNLAGNHDGIFVASSSNNSMVKNNITANNGDGIHLDSSLNNSICENNIIGNKKCGIVLWDCSNCNSIVGNSITANKGCGIVLSGTGGLYGCSNCIISGNSITANNEEGINLNGSSRNSIVRNILAENLFCFKFTDSWNNFIYHNNLLDNANQVFAWKSANVWDNGVEGNYWSRHAGEDLDKDGICDCPYTSCENNTDNCPLMRPYMLGDVNHDAKVNIVDINIIAKAFGTKCGDEKWNPHADIDENGEINAADIATAAKEFRKIWKYP